MAKSERRLRVRLIGLGIALSVLAVLADQIGLLGIPESLLYDKRAKWCQFFAPKPSAAIVHLDIDDPSLESIGRWPWSREKQAELFDELHLAGPKAVVFDILYTQPEDDRWAKVQNDDGTSTFVEHKPDDLLTAAIGRLGTALVPSSLRIGELPPVPPDFRRIHQLLYENLDLNESQVKAALGKISGSAADFESAFIIARQKVAEVRVEELWGSLLPAGVDIADPQRAAALKSEMRTHILTHADLSIGSPAVHALDDAFDRVLSAQVLRRLTFPIPAGTRFYTPQIASLPTPRISSAAAATGFVDYPTTLDGKVRSVPLFVQYDGRMVPQIGLMMASMLLDVSPKDFVFSSDSVTIPMKGKSKGWSKPWTHDIVIPVRTYHSDLVDQPVATWFDIPWYGGSNWEAMFDPAHPGLQKQHVSMNAVDAACRTAKRIALDNHQIDKSLQIILAVTGEATIRAFLDHAPADNVPLSRKDVVASTCAVLKGLGIPLDKSPDDKDITEQSDRVLFKAIRAMQTADQQSEALATQLDAQRRFLRDQLNGKGVLIGAIGTGMDLKASSIHKVVPGVVVHGTIVNAILTGRLWRTAPRWVTVLTTLLIGALMTAIISWLTPGRAMFASALLAAIYLFVNGIVLFDGANVIVGLAGPLAAIIFIWSNGTLIRLVSERIEKARITRRFRNYVDPSLVNWVLEHPDKTRFDGEVREMTMCFSDLVSFTSLTEKLGEKTVPLLAEYMSAMIPPIRSNRGYVSKLMGDGIYFFFGAPQTDPNHATNAVKAVYAMGEGLKKLNVSLAERGLPQLAMRIGVTTGRVVIGDAGGTDCSDYTAMGDSVNLASRLESANKPLGTSILLSHRTVELLNGDYLVRPIANLRVIGRQQGELVYEPLCPVAEASQSHQLLAQQTAEMVEAFSRAEFDRCLKAADQLEHFADSAKKLAKLYRKLATQYIETPPADFDGQVILTEK